MPWPYLEWNILSPLLVDLLSIKHPTAQGSHRPWRCHSESVVEDILPLYCLFLIKKKQAVQLFCFLRHVSFGHLFKQFVQYTWSFRWCLESFTYTNTRGPLAYRASFTWSLVYMELRLHAQDIRYQWRSGELVWTYMSYCGLSDWMMGLKSVCWQWRDKTQLSWPLRFLWAAYSSRH